MALAFWAAPSSSALTLAAAATAGLGESRFAGSAMDRISGLASRPGQMEPRRLRSRLINPLMPSHAPVTPKNCGRVCLGQHCWPGGAMATMFAPPTEALVGSVGAAGAAAGAGARQPIVAPSSNDTMSGISGRWPMRGSRYEAQKRQTLLSLSTGASEGLKLAVQQAWKDRKDG